MSDIIKDESVVCSFCGRTREESGQLIAGNGVYICDSCVSVCYHLLKLN